MKKRILQSPILDYAYNIIEDDVQTYLVVKNKDTSISIIEHQHFYLAILGDRLIQKLEGKGYITLDEVKQKYQISDIKEKTKVKNKKKSTHT